jgi:hypothetical protein
VKSGQSPESVLTDPQQYPGVERVGSKPVASAPFLLLVDLCSFSFLTTPHEKTLGLEKFNHDNGLHAGLTGKFGKDAVRGTPQARCAS